MTNKTIANLKKLKSFHNGSYGADIDRAIEVLEQEPCYDAISRLAVKELYYKDGYIDFRKICGLPPVKPQEPKTGHWIEDTNGTYTDNHDTWECSECGHAQILLEGTPKDNDYNYCPNCGAKMVEPQESEVQDADSN